MRRYVWMATIVVGLIGGGRGLHGESPSCERPQESFLRNLGPAGGWLPYGGGLLGWWDPFCFPRCVPADSYCRKPLPQIRCQPCCPDCQPHPKSRPQ
jgi:hypothetical protein